MGRGNSARGAYGIALQGSGIEDFLPEVPANWPLWRVRNPVEAVADDDAGIRVGPDEAVLSMPGEGAIVVDRLSATISYRTRRRQRVEALVHPLLSPAASIVAHWSGRAAFHAAAVLVDGRAWGILGDRNAGKSTTAALFCASGHELLTDDLLVLESTTAYAGPPTIDLREQAGSVLGGDPLGKVGSRERWRLEAPAAPSTAPLAGWIALEWASRPDVIVVPPSQRLSVLGPQHPFPIGTELLLELLEVPMLRFSRPSSLEEAGGGIELLLQAIAEQHG